MSTVRAAVVQAAPVFLDREKTVEKACGLIEEAGRNGAQLVVFPETWVPGYPVWAGATARWNYPPSKKVFTRLFHNSVEIPGPDTRALGEAARHAGTFVAMGINERTPDTGTLYNTILYLHKDGSVLGRHRKLVPTYHERMIWGMGDGSTLQVFDTEIGRLGGLICWEHWMPLARYALYSQGLQLHASLWPSGGETLHLACRAMAHEGRVFVLAACSYLTKEHLPADFELRPEMEALPPVLSRGGSAIIGPDGKYLSGPVFDEETILYADLDMDRIVEEKHYLDVVGHYARPDVLRLLVDRRPLSPATFTPSAAPDVTQEVERLVALADTAPPEELKAALRDLLGRLHPTG